MLTTGNPLRLAVRSSCVEMVLAQIEVQLIPGGMHGQKSFRNASSRLLILPTVSSERGIPIFCWSVSARSFVTRYVKVTSVLALVLD